MHRIARLFLMLFFCSAPAWADINWGGWAEVSLVADTKPGSLPGFDVHPWYLYVQAEPIENVRFFGELEFEHVFKVEAGEIGFGELKIERLYVEKEFSSEHHLRAGKFVNPFGFWYRLHWNFLTETVSSPFTMDNEAVPQHQIGVQYWGRAFSGDNEFSYFAWVGNGPDLFGARRTVWQPGVGASGFVTHTFGGREDLSLGASLGVHLQWVTDADVGIVRQLNGVAGLEAKLIRFDVRGEFYVLAWSNGAPKFSTYGTLVGWILPQQLAGTYRFDWGTDPAHTVGGSTDLAQAHSIGVLWRPHAQVLARVEARWISPVDRALAPWWTGTVSVAVKY